MLPQVDPGEDVIPWAPPGEAEPLRIVEGARSWPDMQEIDLYLSCSHIVTYKRPEVARVIIDPSRMVH